MNEDTQDGAIDEASHYGGDDHEEAFDFLDEFGCDDGFYRRM